jgi:peptidoglycan/LPS O-acetylase OafA/YrhL
MDLLLAGVLAAAITRRIDVARYLPQLRAALPVAMVLLIGAVGVSPYRFFIIFSPTLESIGIACFILGIAHGAPEGVRYRSAVLQYFGRISYTLYLVHQPVSGVLHGLILGNRPDIQGTAEIAVTLLSAVVSIGIAAVSWSCLEAPILDRTRAYHAALIRKRLVA